MIKPDTRRFRCKEPEGLVWSREKNLSSVREKISIDCIMDTRILSLRHPYLLIDDATGIKSVEIHLQENITCHPTDASSHTLRSDGDIVCAIFLPEIFRVVMDIHRSILHCISCGCDDAHDNQTRVSLMVNPASKFASNV